MFILQSTNTYQKSYSNHLTLRSSVDHILALWMILSTEDSPSSFSDYTHTLYQTVERNGNRGIFPFQPQVGRDLGHMWGSRSACHMAAILLALDHLHWLQQAYTFSPCNLINDSLQLAYRLLHDGYQPFLHLWALSAFPLTLPYISLRPLCHAEPAYQSSWLGLQPPFSLSSPAPLHFLRDFRIYSSLFGPLCFIGPSRGTVLPHLLQ